VDPAEVERINQIPNLSDRLWELESVLVSLGVIRNRTRTHNLIDLAEIYDVEIQDRCLFALMHVRQYAPPVIQTPIHQTRVTEVMLAEALDVDGENGQGVLESHYLVEDLMIEAGLITPA
jgi:hypothetical protein